MSTEQNKALVRRWVEDVINQQKVDPIDETHTSNYVNHFLPPNAPQGQEAEKHFTQMFIDAFADGKFNIEDLIAEGDKVAMRYTYTGTHTGNFQGIPATGKKFSVGGINVLRVANGRLAENWVAFDLMGL